jgi:DNA-binding Xre family transcriptional regulator
LAVWISDTANGNEVECILPFKQVLPRRVTTLRSFRSLSQAQLAKEAGIATSTVCAIETGQITDLKLSTLLSLCEVLQVTPDYLLGFDRNEKLVSKMMRLDYPDGWKVRITKENTKCAVCDALLAKWSYHTPADCMVMQHQKGKTIIALANFYGLPVDGIQFILDKLYDRMRSAKPARFAQGA